MRTIRLILLILASILFFIALVAYCKSFVDVFLVYIAGLILMTAYHVWDYERIPPKKP